MELFWNDQPNQKLKEIELAEKNWCLANERLKKLEAFCVTHYGYYNERGVIVECDDGKPLDDLRQVVSKLWNEYVSMKPNVSDDTKKKLGLLKEVPSFKLENLEKLSKKRTFEELTDRVQKSIDAATYREEELGLAIACHVIEDVTQVIKTLRTQGFDVDLQGKYLKFQYKY